MQRTFMYFAAFTGMGTDFVAAVVVAALVTDRVSPATGNTPSASAEPTAAASQVAEGPIGEITITAFDLGFDPENANPELATDVDYAMILNDGPLGFSINGKGFPATEPHVLQQGQTIRIRYMNEGLQMHPMHLHRIPQLVVAKVAGTSRRRTSRTPCSCRSVSASMSSSRPPSSACGRSTATFSPRPKVPTACSAW